MKVNKLIAVPVLALAAGIGLAGCSGSGGSSPYNQGMAWEASQEQADGRAVLINMDALNLWCQENQPADMPGSWADGCETSYVNHHGRPPAG